MKLISLIICLFLISRCTLMSDTITEEGIGFFEDTNCMELCWRGLRIGETTQNDLYEFLETTDYQVLQTFESGFLTVFTTHETNNHNVIFFLEEDNLIAIEINGNIGSSFQEVIDRFPVLPDVLIHTFETGGFGFQPYAMVNLLYPDLGIFIQLELPLSSENIESRNICLSELDELDSIYITNAYYLEDIPIMSPPQIPNSMIIFDVNQVKKWSTSFCYSLE